MRNLGLAGLSLSLLMAVMAMSADAAAQIPDKFTNLQALPKDIPKAELVGIMRTYAGDLGVRCGFCHVGGDPDTLQGVNFASDDSDKKKTARLMIRMVQSINQDQLPKLGKKPSPQVSCVTCHRRNADPRTIDALLTESINKDGAPAAVTLYRKLKTENYGNGKYDFSDIPLNQLGESLLDSDKIKEATAVLELDAELNPQSEWGRYLLGVAHASGGEKEKARADFQKVLEFNPKNSMAKKHLADLDQPGK
ncbi:MAG: c-type cytochrome [Candidatus Angelobacter sp.]